VINLLPAQLKEVIHRGKKHGGGVILFLKVQPLGHEGTKRRNMKLVFTMSYPGGK